MFIFPIFVCFIYAINNKDVREISTLNISVTQEQRDMKACGYKYFAKYIFTSGVIKGYKQKNILWDSHQR